MQKVFVLQDGPRREPQDTANWRECYVKGQIIGKVSPNYQTSQSVSDCVLTIVTSKLLGRFFVREKKISQAQSLE